MMACARTLHAVQMLFTLVLVVAWTGSAAAAKITRPGELRTGADQQQPEEDTDQSSLQLISDKQLASSIETLLDDRTELIVAELQNLREKNARLERKLIALEARERERSAVVQEATADPQAPLHQQASPTNDAAARRTADGWSGDGPWPGDGAQSAAPTKSPTETGWTGDGWSGDGAPAAVDDASLWLKASRAKIVLNDYGIHRAAARVLAFDGAIKVSGDVDLVSRGASTNGRYKQYVQVVGFDPTNAEIVDITVPTYATCSLKVRVTGRGTVALITQWHSEQTYAISTDQSSASIQAGTQVDIDKAFELTGSVTAIDGQNRRVIVDVTGANVDGVTALVELVSSKEVTDNRGGGDVGAGTGGGAGGSTAPSKHGVILQVVQAYLRKGEAITGDAGSHAIPGLSATITPKSSSSKILVVSHVSGTQKTHSSGLHLTRGDAKVGLAGASGGKILTSFSGDLYKDNPGYHLMFSAQAAFLDGSAHDAATPLTYSVVAEQLAGSAEMRVNVPDYDEAGAVYNNLSPSHLTLLEVAGAGDAGGGPGGVVLGVHQAYKRDVFDNAVPCPTPAPSCEQDIPGLSLSVTPNSASSQFLVISFVSGYTWDACGGCLALVRDGSTKIGLADSDATYSGTRTSFAGDMYRSSLAGKEYAISSAQAFYLDSPATTETVNYKVVPQSSATQFKIGRAMDDSDAPGASKRTVSSLTVLEIEGSDADSGAGVILNVVQAYKTDTTEYTTSTATSDAGPIPGLSVSVTPRSSASKFLVTSYVSGSSTDKLGGGLYLQREVAGTWALDAASDCPCADANNAAWYTAHGLTPGSFGNAGKTFTFRDGITDHHLAGKAECEAMAGCRYLACPNSKSTTGSGYCEFAQVCATRAPSTAPCGDYAEYKIAATKIGLADAAGHRTRTSFSGDIFVGTSTNSRFMLSSAQAYFLDAPWTGGVVTYSVGAQPGAGTTRINAEVEDGAGASRGVSHITVYEIAYPPAAFPAGAVEVEFKVWGAGGGGAAGADGAAGGSGGFASCTIALAEGTVVQVVVGAGGGKGTSGHGGAGGGYAGAFFGGRVSQATAIIVAGGGGGGNRGASGKNNGGGGGGAEGVGGEESGVTDSAGKGGTQTAGGASTHTCAASCVDSADRGQSGTPLQGGNARGAACSGGNAYGGGGCGSGYITHDTSTITHHIGGGGGGGYWGGGGGGCRGGGGCTAGACCVSGAGGGGSGFTHEAASASVFVPGNGDGSSESPAPRADDAQYTAPHAVGGRGEKVSAGNPHNGGTGLVAVNINGNGWTTFSFTGEVQTFTVSATPPTPTPPTECPGTGVFDLTVPGIGQRSVTCDNDSDGGNWKLVLVNMNGQTSPAGTGSVAIGNLVSQTLGPGKFADTVINALAVNNEYRYICKGTHNRNGSPIHVVRFFKLGGDTGRDYVHGPGAGVKEGDKCKTTNDGAWIDARQDSAEHFS